MRGGKGTKQLPAEEMLESIDIDIFVSDKMMRFIREFFIMTTYQIENSPQANKPQANKQPANNTSQTNTSHPTINPKYFSDGFTGIYYCT